MYFCTRDVYFSTFEIYLYFESKCLYFGRALLYFESIPLNFESIFLYVATMLASGCIDNQYSKGKEKVVINIHFKDANLFAVGGTTYAYCWVFETIPAKLKTCEWFLLLFARMKMPQYLSQLRMDIASQSGERVGWGPINSTVKPMAEKKKHPVKPMAFLVGSIYNHGTTPHSCTANDHW